MTPFWQSSDGLVETFVGDSLDVLRQMPDDSVHCCVTSPPYFGLRDYGTASWDGGDSSCDHLGKPMRTKSKINANTDSGGTDVKNGDARDPMGRVCSKCGARRVDQQIGLEQTPAEFIAALVEVFREVRRVLHPSGTLWVNMGDSYANDGKWGGKTGGKHIEGLHGQPVGRGKRSTGLKQKDLIGMPWQLAFALRDDGWYLRQDIIWSKPNPMPESIADRCCKSHEYVFLLSKRPRYFHDAEAIKTPISAKTLTVTTTPVKGNGTESTGEKLNTWMEENGGRYHPSAANKRSVWTVTPAPYSEAHFATYPPELIRPMIRAGTSEKGCCPKCLAPWVRVTSKSRKATRPGTNTKINGIVLHPDSPHQSHSGTIVGNRDPKRHCTVTTTTGWKPSCECNAGEPAPCRVLDPFGGSGTTGMVSRQEGRRCTLIELNPEYAKLHRRRVEERLPEMKDENAPLFAAAVGVDD